jgi:hypothetical protein
MKRQVSNSAAAGALLAGLLLSATTASAALLAYEPFTNAVGINIIGTSGGLGFSDVWTANGSGVATNTDFSLNYTDTNGNVLKVDGGDSVHGAAFFQGLTTANTSLQPHRQFNFSRGTNGTDGVTTWISFLAVRQGPANGTVNNPYARGANVAHDFSSGNSTTTTFTQKLAIGNSSGSTTNTVGLIPLGGSSNLKQTTVVFSQTNFIVVRVDHTTGATFDNAFIWVNPLIASEPSTNACDTNSLGTFDFSFDRCRVFSGGQSSAAQPYAEWLVDEYRVGETFADVAPIAGGGSSSYPSTWAGITVVGNSPILTLSGTANATYTVQSNPNVANSAGWVNIGSVTLNGSGIGTFTNAAALNSNARLFYRAKSP